MVKVECNGLLNYVRSAVANKEKTFIIWIGRLREFTPLELFGGFSKITWGLSPVG